MDWLELSEDWRVEQKNSLEVNFYLQHFDPKVEVMTFLYAEGHTNGTTAYHTDNKQQPGCQDSLDVQDENVEKQERKAR